MGDLTSNGRGKNKKDAKTKAAENMVLKLEDLPKVVICKVSFNLWLLFRRLLSEAGAKAGVVGQGGVVIRYLKTLFEQNFAFNLAL